MEARVNIVHTIILLIVFNSFIRLAVCEKNITDCCPQCRQDDLYPEGKKESVVYIPSNYVKTHPPIDNGNKPLNISIKFLILAIREVSADRMEMEVDLLVYVTWVDYRLKINQKIVDEKGGRIPLGENGRDLWHPYVQLRNCKGCKPLDIDPDTFIIHYHAELKQLWTVIRLVEHFSCNIDLRRYPMDTQICRIQLENYYESTALVNLLHVDKEGPFEITSGLTISAFKIDKIESGECAAVYGNISFACMELIVYLSRSMGYHLTTTYAPTMFIVLISWISFWIPANIAPARITLGVTTLLTLSTRLDQAQKNLPPVSYVKAIDVWMFACIFLVFASLIEFALSFYTHSFGSSVQPAAPKVNLFIRSRKKSSPRMNGQINQTTRCSSSTKTTMIDRVSQILFPVSFLLFNIVYWSYYLS